ncbi:MAG: c-type cytochrome [Nitrospinota bacterium]|nr:c-type cytochrome [Nitrospinota bacterium]
MKREMKLKQRIYRWSAPVVLIAWAMVLGVPSTLLAAGECPQKRKTPTAPQKFLSMQNPIAPDEANFKAGEKIFQIQGKPITCQTCHGKNGDGQSDAGFESTPTARNFSCADTMSALPDGQLFWIIRNGSPKTSMFAFPSLSDNQVWQLIHYIRQFAKK